MRVSSVLSAILLIGTCVAQHTVPDSKVVIRSSTREVLLEVVVRDARGRLVKKIDPEQVSIFEDGVISDRSAWFRAARSARRTKSSWLKQRL